MKPETDLILKLAGELIDKIGSSKTSNTTSGKLPPQIQRKVDSYNMFTNLWSNADDDLLALLALVELMWEKSIHPLSLKDENKLQIDFGVNAFSASATKDALSRMNDTKKQLELQRLKNEAIINLAKVVAGRSLLGGPLNASQITFDKLGYEKVHSRATSNIKALNSIIKKIGSIMNINEQTAKAHGVRL